MSNLLQNPQTFDTISSMHAAGLQLGKTVVLYGVGFSVGRNIIRTIRGKVRGAVAVANVIRDAAICFGFSYICGLLAGGAIKMATGTDISSAFGARNFSGISGVSGVGDSASSLSTAANDFITGFTGNLFGVMSSAGSSAGDALVSATTGTAIGGAVSATVQTLGTLGTIVGASTASAVPAVLLGAIIGGVFALVSGK